MGRGLLNSLFFHEQATCYEWEFEKFMAHYVALDGLWAVGAIVLGWHSRTHKGRLAAMCRLLGLELNSEAIEQIGDARNALFHEGVWGSADPVGGPRFDEYPKLRYLQGIVARVAVALLGIRNTYTRSPWTDYLNGNLQWDETDRRRCESEYSMWEQLEGRSG